MEESEVESMSQGALNFFEEMHQPGSIELFFQNKGEAEQSKSSELKHIDNATKPKSRKQTANSLMFQVY